MPVVADGEGTNRCGPRMNAACCRPVYVTPASNRGQLRLVFFAWAVANGKTKSIWRKLSLILLALAKAFAIIVAKAFAMWVRFLPGGEV